MMKKKVDVGDIVAATAKHFGIPGRVIRENHDDQPGQNKARDMAISLATMFSGESVGTIAGAFGIKESPEKSIAASCSMVKNWTQAKPSPRLIASLNAIKSSLGLPPSKSTQMAVPAKAGRPKSKGAPFLKDRRVLIDGLSMLLMGKGGDGKVDLDFLKAMICALERDGVSDYDVYFDEKTPHFLRAHGKAGSERLFTEWMSKSPHMYMLPRNLPVEHVLLFMFSLQKTVGRTPVVFTNDSLLSYAKQYPFVRDRTRFVPGVMLDGEVVFPSIGWRFSA